MVYSNVREFKSILREQLVSVWQERWEGCPHGRVTHRFLPHVAILIKAQWFDPSMELLFLLTGHGSLNQFLCDRGLSASSLCSCGGTETWDHVLLECPLYEDFRVLRDFGVVSRPDGTFELDKILRDETTYLAVNSFAVEVFKRRRLRIM